MSEVNKENEKKKKQGRKSEEGIIQIIFRKNIGGNKTTFSNRQLYSSFTLPMASRVLGFVTPLLNLGVTTWISPTYLKESEAVKTCDIHISDS
jgi:hypothetical protein